LPPYLADHVVHLLVRERVSEVGHDDPQLDSGTEAVAVRVEHLEPGVCTCPHFGLKPALLEGHVG